MSDKHYTKRGFQRNTRVMPEDVVNKAFKFNTDAIVNAPTYDGSQLYRYQNENIELRKMCEAHLKEVAKLKDRLGRIAQLLPADKDGASLSFQDYVALRRLTKL